MIQVATFGVGQRGDKWHSTWEADGESMEGPARDTEAEAVADRDEAIRLFRGILRRAMPGVAVTTGKVQ